MSKNIVRRPDGRYTVYAHVWPNLHRQWTSEEPVDRGTAVDKLHEMVKELKAERSRPAPIPGSLKYDTLGALIKFHHAEVLRANPKKPDKQFAGIPESIWNQIETAHGTTPVKKNGNEYPELAKAYASRIKYLEENEYAVATINKNKQVFACVFSLCVKLGKLDFIPCLISCDKANKRDIVRTDEEKDDFDHEMLSCERLSPFRFAVWIKERNKIRPDDIFRLPKDAYKPDIDRIVFVQSKTDKLSAFLEIPEWFGRIYFRLIPADCPYLFPILWEENGIIMWRPMPKEYWTQWSRLCKRAGIEGFHFKDLDHEAWTYMRERYTKLELELLGQDMADSTDKIYFHTEQMKVQRKPEPVKAELLQFPAKKTA